MSEQYKEPEDFARELETVPKGPSSESSQAGKSEASQPVGCECPPGCVGLPCCP